MFTERAAQNPSKLMFISESRKYTFQDADHYTNQVANFATRLGLKKGDDVALFMDSTPEYVMLWLGLAKAGIVSALVNNNLKLDTLAHSINIVNAKMVIFDREHSEAVADAIPLLKRKDIKYFMVDDDDAPKGTQSIKRDLERESKSFNLIPTNFTDKLLHIYTSGTTGKTLFLSLSSSPILIIILTCYYCTRRLPEGSHHKKLSIFCFWLWSLSYG